MRKDNLSNFEIVTVAVARLGGETTFIHLEDIAIEAFDIAPSRFAWRIYADRIDLEAVRRTLTGATAKKPALLVGSVRRGWMLTRFGREWVGRNPVKIKPPSGARRGSTAEAIQIEQMRLKETSAWEKFSSGDAKKITLNDLFDFVRVNEYFSDTKREERFNIVSIAVESDDGLSKLWNYMKKAFPKEFLEAHNE